MSSVHLRRSDETVLAIINAAFPGYKGTHITATIGERVTFHGTTWDEGNKRDYVIVRLSDMMAQPVSQAPYFRDSPLHTTAFPIPDGFVIVVLIQARGREYLDIIAPASAVTPFLPPPNELSRDEMIVLIATRSRKASYGGISNYRFSEARRETGITLDRWEAAKATLIDKKLLNKAGAITVEGRNAVGMKDLYEYRPQAALAQD